MQWKGVNDELWSMTEYIKNELLRENIFEEQAVNVDPWKSIIEKWAMRSTKNSFSGNSQLSNRARDRSDHNSFHGYGEG